MQRVLARTLGVAAIVAAASLGVSGLASANGDGGDGYTTTTTTTKETTTTEKATTTESPTTTPREVTTTKYTHPSTTASPTTTPREVTTTTHKPYTTTTAEHATTTEKATTTTAKATTTTAGPTTTKPSTTTTPKPPHKVFVCKYVGKPGVDERLQEGGNPISVDIDSLKNFTGIGSFFNDKQGRSVAIAFDTGQPEPDVSDCPKPPGGGTTTTSVKPTTTTAKPTTTTSGPTSTTGPTTTTTTGGSTTTSTSTGGTTTTTQPGSTTTSTPPRPSLFGIDDFATCANGAPAISITFGVRPELNGLIGQLSIISLPNGLTVVTNQSLTFVSGGTTVIPYPAVAAGTTSATLNYNLSGEFATASVGPPPTDCAQATTTTTTGGTTSTTAAATTTTSVAPTTTGTGVTTTTVAATTTLPGATTTLPGATTTTAPGATTTLPGATTTLPATFSFGAAATVCVSEVPTIRITFLNQFPSLAGQTGTLTFADVNGRVVGSQPLVYRPNTTVDVLYPGTRVNADGSIADVPGWNLVGGFWVRDPSDAFLREGINLTYTVNPTATAFVTYPPESANCANPDGPFPPGTPSTPAPGTPGNTTIPGTPTQFTELPHTGVNTSTLLLAAVFAACGGVLLLISRRPRRV